MYCSKWITAIRWLLIGGGPFLNIIADRGIRAFFTGGLYAPDLFGVASAVFHVVGIYFSALFIIFECAQASSLSVVCVFSFLDVVGCWCAVIAATRRPLVPHHCGSCLCQWRRQLGSAALPN